MALNGMQPTPNQQQQEGSGKRKGGSFKFVTPAPKHDDSTVQSKNKIYTNIKINHAT